MSDERIGPCGKHCAVVDECDARGREILRLRAENEKLRAALKETLEIASRNEAGDYQQRAAAALKETGDES